MKKLLATAAFIVAASQAIAETRYARVISVQPNYVTQYQNIPRQQCQDVEVPVYGQESGVNTEGAIIGGLVGGILGNQVGGGSGREAATGVGAIAGAIIGGNSGNRQVTGYRTERQCAEVMVREEVRSIRNYTITYEWNGIRGSSYTFNNYSVGDNIAVTVSINAN
jgi:uncharacterized protein YcfJ